MTLILKEDHTFAYHNIAKQTSGLISLLKGDQCFVTNDIENANSPEQNFDLMLQNPDIIIPLQLRNIRIYFTGTYDDITEGKLLSVGEVVDIIIELINKWIHHLNQ